MFKEKEISSSESDITTNGSTWQKAAGQTLIMDSEVQRDGRVLDLTDDAWREDRLPYEDVTIPLSELPESEQDNGGSTESVKEQEMKWSDLALQSLHENTPNVGT
ncbi:hypothetical protein cypCar_00016896 [Cyprinus carpio]|nr:hypothetical protein cypCar_00016896 [Cyprinus carpio]